MQGRSVHWDGYVGQDGFRSGTDTGKWMFRLPAADADGAMDPLYDAVSDGAIPATKRSTGALEKILGGDAILIAYCRGKDPVSAGRPCDC